MTADKENFKKITQATFLKAKLPQKVRQLQQMHDATKESIFTLDNFTPGKFTLEIFLLCNNKANFPCILGRK